MGRLLVFNNFKVEVSISRDVHIDFWWWFGHSLSETRSSTGLGRSSSAEAPAATGELAPAAFLTDICERLELSPVVLISPSLSGMYSLPFLLQHQHLLRAYIPVAPICTEKISAQQYRNVKVTQRAFMILTFTMRVVEHFFCSCHFMWAEHGVKVKWSVCERHKTWPRDEFLRLVN